MNNAYGVVTGPGTIRFERVLPGPIERVWAYLTEAEKRAKWFAGGEMELTVGGRADLVFDHENITDEPTPEAYRHVMGKVSLGHVTRCEAPRLLAYTWWEEEGEEPEEITFELEPRNDEVLLTLTHRRLTSRDDTLKVAGGWHLHLGILEDRLRGVKPRGFWRQFDQFKKEYEGRIPQEG